MHFRRVWLTGILGLAVALPAFSAAPATAACDPGASQPAPRPLEDRVEFDAWLTTFVGCEMTAGHVPGTVVAVVKGGQVFSTRGFGMADLATRRPVDPGQTLFRIASLTKTVTATAILQLVERGRLTLDTDVRRYVDFPLRLTSDRPITVANLLTHRGGFENGVFGVLSESATSMPPLRSVLAETMPTQVREPGTISAYSNHGFTLLAYVAERVTGEPFDRYLHDNLFVPLGMTRTSFAQPLPADLAGQVVTEYSFEDGRLVPHRFEIVLAAGGGAISSTGVDMARFMLAQLNHGTLEGHRVLATDTARTLQAVHFSYGRAAGGMGYGFPHMTVNGYDVLWHTGALHYSFARLSLIPEAGIGLFVAGNSDTAAELQDRLFIAFMNRYLPARSAPAAPRPLPANAAEYAGYYRPSGAAISTFAALRSVADTATVRIGGQGLQIERGGRVQEYVPVGPDRFRPLATDAVLHGDAVFFRDVTGSIAGYSPENRATSAMVRVHAVAQTPPVVTALVGGVVGVMALALPVLALAYFRSRATSRLEKLARLLMTLTSAGTVGTLLATTWITALVSKAGSVPWQLQLYLAATSLLAGIACAAAVAVIPSVVDTGLARAWRAARALWCAAALVEAWLLGYWNLIGFHYY